MEAIIPTENELKFVLNLDCEKQIKKHADKYSFLKQAYLDHSHIRIRRIEEKNKKHVFQFCYKHHAPHRLIEIETDIDDRDFNDLWEDASSRLEKIRYELSFKKNIWVVDFFKTKNGNTYFAQAEHEMPEKQLKPLFIPDIIAENLVYEVPHSDGRFTSRKLWNVEYAKKLYDIIRR